jgi:hypothetical protein
MDCTTNIIGYKSCGVASKFYLDDYGLSLNSASKVNDDKFTNAKEMLNKIISQSWNETFNEVTFDGFNANKILNDVTYGDMDFSDSFTGVKETTFILDKSCTLGSFYLSQLNVYIKTGGLTTVSLIDGTTETELYSNDTEDSTVIELAINSFVSDTFKIKIITDGEVWTGIGSSECGCHSAPYYSVNTSDSLFPFTLTFQVRCNKLVHLCKYVDILAPIVIAKILGKYWFKIHTTDVFSNYVNSEKERAIPMMAYYDSEYLSLTNNEDSKILGQYQILLSKLNIPKPTCKCCMECKSTGWGYRSQKP